MDLPQILNSDQISKLSSKISRFDPHIVLGPEGPLAKEFANYESRPPQIQMAENVAQNMRDLKHFFCEAGTGTGKSYAFLIPAIELALNGEGPIVISTNTISLQEQIFRKDIPDLKRYLGINDLRVVLRKGRGNYISRRRHKNAQNFPWEVDQITEIEDIDNWVEQTNTGTIQDLDFIPSPLVWEEVRSDQYDCLGQKCSNYTSCFYFKSKEEAACAHIIVTNHALLTLDLMLKHKTDENVTILPKFKHLIIDEAHALEDALRKADTFEWKQGSAKHLIKRATNRKDTGFLDSILKNSEVPQNVVTRSVEAIEKLKHFSEVNDQFFDRTVIPFLKNEIKKEIKAPTSKRVKAGNLKSTSSDKLINTLHEANKYLAAITSELKRVSDDEFASRNVKQLAILIEKYWGRTKETESELKRTIEANKEPDDALPHYVSSAEASPTDHKVYYKLVSTPIFVRQTAQKILFGKIPSITLTSATLTTSGSFKLITRNLGAIIPKTKTLKLPEIFDYQKQVRLILTPNLPIDPWNKFKEREDYFDLVATRVEKYIYYTNGNAFVLCTSNKLMNALHKRSKYKLEQKGIYVLKQNDGLTREQIVEEFKQVPNSVLYAVDSFWTGVDIPGDHLQNVIIPKLPFPPPTPLSEAQQEIYDIWNKGKPRIKKRNYFSDRVVPAVAIKLQQGFGRLIRHKSDKGIVVIMDPRLSTKAYGKILLQSLPSTKIVMDKD